MLAGMQLEMMSELFYTPKVYVKCMNVFLELQYSEAIGNIQTFGGLPSYSTFTLQSVDNKLEVILERASSAITLREWLNQGAPCLIIFLNSQSFVHTYLCTVENLIAKESRHCFPALAWEDYYGYINV